jgi:hypothetical protein
MLDLIINMQAGAARKGPSTFVCNEQVRQVGVIAAPVCPVIQSSIRDLIFSVHAVLHHVPETNFGNIAPNQSFKRTLPLPSSWFMLLLSSGNAA